VISNRVLIVASPTGDPRTRQFPPPLSVSPPPMRNSGNQWHFSVLRTEGAVQCIISRSTSREWNPGDARLRKEDRREADDLEIRLRASLPSSLASSRLFGCRRPPGVRKRRTQEEFLNSFSRPVCARHSRYLRSYLLLLPYHSRCARFLSFRSRWFADFQSVETGTFKFNNVTGYFSSFGIKCE